MLPGVMILHDHMKSQWNGLLIDLPSRFAFKVMMKIYLPFWSISYMLKQRSWYVKTICIFDFINENIGALDTSSMLKNAMVKQYVILLRNWNIFCAPHSSILTLALFVIYIKLQLFFNANFSVRTKSCMPMIYYPYKKDMKMCT